MQDAAGIVLVEGRSDKAAVETLAQRLGRDLAGEGVAVISLGGASGFGAFLGDLAESGFSGRLAGLYDAGEVDDVRWALDRAGLGSNLSVEAIEQHGIFGCVADLEDELIRALGVAAVEGIFARHGELKGFRKMQNQPAWRGRDSAEQAHRFIGIKSGRKVRYGRLLVEAVNMSRVPRPLAMVLERV